MIVFGILERDRKVSVEIMKNVTAETLMEETMKKVRRGCIAYTDKWKGYDSLMFSGYEHINIITHIHLNKEKSSLTVRGILEICEGTTNKASRDI